MLAQGNPLRLLPQLMSGHSLSGRWARGLAPSLLPCCLCMRPAAADPTASCTPACAPKVRRS